MYKVLTGKGQYLWKIKNAEDGDPDKIAEAAKSANLSHVIIKILDGPWLYNLRPYYDSSGNLKWADDILGPVVEALHGVGVEVWGFQWLKLDSPAAEASAAKVRVAKYGLDGFVINAEADAKSKFTQAGNYAANLLGVGVPVSLSSYRYPDGHQSLPWSALLSVCDVVMPQVYWELDHDPVYELHRTIDQYAKITNLPMIPTGSAYNRGSTWVATTDDLLAFMQAAQDAGLTAVNFWEWAEAKQNNLWDTIAQFNYAGDPAPIPGPDPTPDPDPAPAPAPGLRMRVINEKGLTVRISPALGTKELGVLPLGAEITVEDVGSDYVGAWVRHTSPAWPAGGWSCAQLYSTRFLEVVK